MVAKEPAVLIHSGGWWGGAGLPAWPFETDTGGPGSSKQHSEAVSRTKGKEELVPVAVVLAVSINSLLA